MNNQFHSSIKAISKALSLFCRIPWQNRMEHIIFQWNTYCNIVQNGTLNNKTLNNRPFTTFTARNIFTSYGRKRHISEGMYTLLPFDIYIRYQ